MAVSPQAGHSDNIFGKIGFSDITQSWTYALTVLYLLLSLGLVTIKRLLPLKAKNLFFFLNHFGLWIILAFGNLGQADKISILITVPETETIWYGYDKKNNYVEPNFAIELTKFTIEFYPPKLGVFENNGKLSDPKTYQPQEIISHQSLNILNNDVYVINLIENALVINDSIRRVTGLPEKTYVAVLKINNDTVYLQNGTEFSPPVIYEIDQNYKLVILNPEPKYFGSEIKLYTKSGITNEIHKIEVNKPLKTGNWRVYQTSYFKIPEFKGYVSVFTAVFDPWLNATYCGIALMFIGAISLIFKRKISKKEE
ncbi:MAG TPA: cytochrome c biogenesis protein ResB [Bacteroidales bacterium]|nr:cytochrome c biogenesis protein ResB [Bacteroidales bacterium]